MGKNSRPKIYDYDLIVIGSGAGGGVAAHILNREGKKVAIVEEEAVGGECPNFGCVPTKALITSADTYEIAKTASEFGINVSSVSYNYSAVKKWKDLAVERTGVKEGDKAYRADGIDVIEGRAHFLDNHTINVNKQRYSAKKFLVATGTSDFIPPIDGLIESGFIRYKEALELSKPPKSLLIVGGGAIGCEFAHIFSTFGSKVTIAEYAPRLLAREDSSAGDELQKIFEKRGLDIHVGTEVFKVALENGKKCVSLRSGGREHIIRVDEIMIATGKMPNTDLGLENARVAFTKRGITVNSRMQTTNPNIYAAGDVVGPYAFTHMASYQSRIAANNMLHSKKIEADYSAVPRCVFTLPEVAAVGLTESEAIAQKIKINTATTPISIIGRANTSNFNDGFVKVISDKNGVLIGATIVSPRAGEMIHELVLAVRLGLTAGDIADTIHAFPTWSEAVRIACRNLV